MENWLAGIAAAFGLALGLGGLIRPRWAQSVVGLMPDPEHPGAAAELRASFGGLYVGMSLAMLASLWAGNGIIGASFAAGMAWIGLALGRGVSMAFDGTATKFNVFSACLEVVTGLMLLAPFIGHFGG